LLHFCAVVSRLSDETRVLAQRLALLEQQQRSSAGASSPSGDDVEEEPGPAWLTSDHPSAEPTRAGKP